MTSLRKYFNISGIVVFLVSFIVFYFSAERTGSLWDCGEFILGAYKLQVVHPPGAPFFILVGRLFTWIADIFSDNPANIAFSINLLSGICTAAMAMMSGWITMMFGKIALVGRDGETDQSQNIALTFAGIVGGLTSAFCSSVWFSAVEGEIYAMSSFFTVLTYWAAVKWYYLSNDRDNDRWLVFSLLAGGLSIGVHLLSLLTFPAIGLLYYFKRYEKRTLLGGLISMAAGVGVIVFIQKIVIVGIPSLWKTFDIFMVNSLGAPVHSGLIPTFLLIGGLAYALLRYARKKNKYLLHLFTVSAVLISIAFTTFGTVVIRANADTPVNMNVPSDATRLLPYLNREQYGERPLLSGAHYDASPKKVNKEDRYGLVNGKYEVVDEKYTYEYAAKDKIFFPRIGHTEGTRPQLHKMWRQQLGGNPAKRPDMAYNLGFLFKYQFNWMYWRYFMWNFVGRQNADQGYYPWDKKDGHWASGISFVDNNKLYNMDELPDTMRNEKSRNFYYFLPLIFGLLGLIFHFSRSREEFLSLLILFIVTGIGIIIYTNQPPNEPRERDYVLVGSFIAFSMWVGLGVIALYDILRNKVKLSGMTPGLIAGLLVLSAPVIMGFQNFDDHSRAEITASRDYAANFLNSVAPNAILFTYGDNDTYPLWYAQEVEGIRTDVRVVNLSLIAVDWYIEKLRKKVNNSPAIKLTLNTEQYRGKNRNQVFFYNPSNPQDKVMDIPMPLNRALQEIGDPRFTTKGQTIARSKHFFLPVNRSQFPGIAAPTDSTQVVVPKIDIRIPEGKNYITKDELAIMDIIASNTGRPIYFATTCKNEKLLGLNDYMQLEGLALRLVPIKTKSDRGFSIYGSGRIASDKLYKNITKKWAWGNFDKKDLFVDRNYMAGVQAMKMSILRGATTLSSKGDHKRAADLVKKYFEGFPHMNFAYDASVIPFINVLIRANEYEEAKKHLNILAEESDQYMKFYDSLDEDDFKQFQKDMQYTMRGVNDVLAMSQMVEDPAFAKGIDAKLAKYMKANTQQNVPN